MNRMILAFIISGVYFFSCVNSSKEDNSKNFVSNAVNNPADYHKDSIVIVDKLDALLKKREGFFQNTAYFDSTRLIVDTILYGPGFDKLAVWVLTKNPVYRQLVPNNNYQYYYDGTCYFGVRHNDSLVLNWIGPSFTNSYSKDDLSHTMKKYFFEEYSTPDTSSLNEHKYNLNDVRFWESSIWNKIN